MARPDSRDDAALVVAMRDGDRDAYGILFDRWFDRVYDVARNIVRNPETAADVAQDTFIVAWERIDRLERVESFGGWLLRIARNRALDRLEREGRSTAQDVDVVTGMHDRGVPDLIGSRRQLDVEEINATRDRDALIHAAAVVLGERDASVLDLHLRHGLTPAEIADELGVTANNAHQLLFRMRAKLGDAIGALVLWRRGNPACPELTELIGSPGASDFDRPTFETVDAHRKTCPVCSERRSALTAPDQLFSAAPILAVPLLLRARVLDHLRSAGIPVDGASNPATDPADPGDPGDPADPADPGDPGDPGDLGDPEVPGHPQDDSPRPDPKGPNPRDDSPRPDPEGPNPRDDSPRPDPEGPDQRDDSPRPDPTSPGRRDDSPWPAPGAAALAGGSDLAPDSASDDDRSNRRAVFVMLAAAAIVTSIAVGVALGRDDPSAGTDIASNADRPTGEPRSGESSSGAGGLAVSTLAPADRSGSTGLDLLGESTTVPTAPDSVLPTATLEPAGPVSTSTARPTVTRPTVTPAPPPPVVTPAVIVPPVTTAPPPPSTPAPPPPSTTTTLAPAPPEIIRFFFGTPPPGALCPTGIPRRFEWTSTGGSSAQLLIDGIPRASVPPVGRYDGCASSGSVATLTVTGPGGTDSANLTVP